MKIGYPCINRSIGCKASSTFRLKHYSEQKLIETINNNIDCLYKILQFNVEHALYFFRISSDIIPFASHEVCKFDWVHYFSKKFKKIGNYIKEHNIRISMHPDQFVLINALDESIVTRSVKELGYHCEFLDAMELDSTAKVQIHIGGVYGNHIKAMRRFIENYLNLPDFVKKRLVIENDDHLFGLKHCLFIYNELGIPIVFDNFHHTILNDVETLQQALTQAISTWKMSDGLAMVDYSAQAKGERLGKHAEHLDEVNFSRFIEATKDFDFDIMLEIKDKEKSAIKAAEIVRKLRDF